ncbi:hypothetical protein B2904_orf1834 [Brachyspira pilosicoli B2904]|uniref:Transmembrane protein n=3 Tax=Brachyspira TaxID=29521 RepID=A0AAJ6GG86_BRAPL|nr:hypothetical protein [Brachyspira pilosicoli]AFR71164.1 hypothetical protein B2904_orf1834 [Brachyspira pilosicoli B2904]WIH91249.1 hypothetical protein NEI02_04610 [Brachyspira pilosicoli]WIH93540.1 hypothetical protein NEI01_04610 [Brachyspira pilosicoli]WIH95829.1 hypothetical protein NEH99_04600 [Brachyspira pilosicoli]SUW00146.1 Uncharacterised protein [Brachyspira pilosicoli]
MSENKLINNSTKKILYFLLVFTLMMFSSIPMDIQILLFDTTYDSEKLIYNIIFNSFYFQVFYFFCYSFLFSINSNFENVNKRTVLITFLSFLLVLLLGIFTSAPLKDEIPNMLDFFMSNIMINKSILSYIIFFIIIVLADNNFKNNISNSFTKLGDIIFFSAIAAIIAFVFWIFIVFLYDRFIFRTNIASDLEPLIEKLIFMSIIFVLSIIPFIFFFIQKRFKTVLSIYISRVLLFIYSFLIFILFFALLYEPIRPFENMKSFIVYNILLYLFVFTLYFVRADYKAGIITKAIYIIFPILAFLFNILVLGASIYRVIISEVKINEVSITVLNTIIAVNLTYIIVQNIKSIITTLKNNVNINEAIIGNNKIYSFIYVYGIYSFIFSFIAPIVMIFLKNK